MKSSLKGKIKRLGASELIVTPAYTRWLTQDGGYPDWVIERISEELRDHGEDQSERRAGGFSASGHDQCPRRQVFRYLNADRMPFDVDVLHRFAQGNWNHLMWQAGMLASGAVDRIEVAVSDDDHRSGGHPDGFGEHDDHGPFGWEHKSANRRNFEYMLAIGKPLDDYVYQCHRYMMATGLRVWSVTVDCIDREINDWKEFVVRYDEDLAHDIAYRLKDLNAYAEDNQLPPVLKKCEDKKGPYRRCPYRHICLSATSDDFDWPEDDGHSVERVNRLRIAPPSKVRRDQ